MLPAILHSRIEKANDFLKSNFSIPQPYKNRNYYDNDLVLAKPNIFLRAFRPYSGYAV